MPIIPKQEPPYYETGSSENATTYYDAILTQTGTSAPTAITLKNTTEATPVWTRNSAGNYTLTMTGKFTANKVQTILGQTNEGGFGVFYTATDTVNTILIMTADFTFTPTDDLLINTPIKITIYP